MAHHSEEDDIEFEASFSGKEEAGIRTRLIALQEKIREANVPVIILLCGVNGSGKNSALGILRDWLDQRQLDLHAYERQDVQKDPIEFRRYWCDTPMNGNTGIFVSSWYSDPMVSHAYGKTDDDALYKRLDECNAFEKVLADSNAIFCKLWFHKNKNDQESFLRALDDDPYEKWRVMPDDWKNCCMAEKFEATTKKIIRYTDKEYAPWFEIETGTFTERLRTAMNVICTRVETQIAALKKEKEKKNGEEKKKKDSLKKPNFVKTLDMKAALSKEEYCEMLPYLRARLNALLMEVKKRGKKVILAFEGPDASGKGGVISRLASSIFVRDCNIFPIAAPTKEEINHNYLWRFWTRLTNQKLLTVFDRTWYGRVLVERIEHFAADKEWKRAYDEINHFEKQLANGRNIVVKFLLYITKDEQMVRFKAREETDYKKWKIGSEDWRNREKWDQYDEAFDDMLTKTNTKHAPWFVVADNNKKYGRIQTMRLLCEYLEKVLDYDPADEVPPPENEKQAGKSKKNKKKKKKSA
ncbi:MAG: polyphosphate kinase [Alphaproteobacteria bacterium]|nr:polyphosphate kinase [Alphaproteobacteria bacterium]